MSDRDPGAGERPRPQYGEYASPEEQRARIRQPDVTDAISAGVAAPVVTASPAPVAAPAPTPAARPVDRLVTMALLAFGFINVIMTIPSVVDYGSFTAAYLEFVGADPDLASRVTGAGWGVAAALVLGVGWLAAAVLSWLSLRAGRMTFWIPLVAGIVCNLSYALLIVLPLLLDPAIGPALTTGFTQFLGGAGS